MLQFGPHERLAVAPDRIAQNGVGRRVILWPRLPQRVHRSPGEYEGLEQRIGGKAVGAVNSGAGDLAYGIQARQGTAPPEVGLDAAHPVVGGGSDRDRLP